MNNFNRTIREIASDLPDHDLAQWAAPTIKINGHIVSTQDYLEKPEEYNNLPMTEDCLETVSRLNVG